MYLHCKRSGNGTYSEQIICASCGPLHPKVSLKHLIEAPSTLLICVSNNFPQRRCPWKGKKQDGAMLDAQMLGTVGTGFYRWRWKNCHILCGISSFFGQIFQLVQLVFFGARVTMEKNNGSKKFLSLWLWPWRRLVVLVEILAQINKPFAVVSALQSVWFIYT